MRAMSRKSRKNTQFFLFLHFLKMSPVFCNIFLSKSKFCAPYSNICLAKSKKYLDRAPKVLYTINRVIMAVIPLFCRKDQTMKKMKVAVVGYGGMGGWHTEHLLKSDVCELAGVYDIKPERNALAESRGIYAYPTYQALLDDKSVELITVAIPNDDHEGVVVAALNAGKNVICEKPVALSLEALENMIAVAEKNGVRFAVHQNRRWDVDYLAMQKIHDSGEIGNVFNIESRIHGSRGIPSDWRGEKEHGGGMIYDWGIHLIDQVMMVYHWAPVKRYLF